jgi:hypothetical protein
VRREHHVDCASDPAKYFEFVPDLLWVDVRSFLAASIAGMATQITRYVGITPVSECARYRHFEERPLLVGLPLSVVLAHCHVL